MGMLLFALGIELLPLVKTIGDHKAAIAMADGEQMVMAGPIAGILSMSHC
jgi:hypothetical protein